ncbi:MAG: hypothetical protein RIR18_1756, partial [Pseudomonadota bacterium]
MCCAASRKRRTQPANPTRILRLLAQVSTFGCLFSNALHSGAERDINVQQAEIYGVTSNGSSFPKLRH